MTNFIHRHILHFYIRRFSKLPFSLLFIIFADTLLAQQATSAGPFTINKLDTWKIHSSVIGEDFTLYVLKTDDYDTTNKRLPVLYMTDGDWNMTVAMNCFSMLRQDYTTHEPLVVGIGYGKNENKRVRDLDPNNGAPAFLSFIEKEVMPFINKTYRTNNEKAIYGYSMGGMFTTYILFNRPELFDKVFIGAPGNNGYQLMPAARAYFKDHTDLKSKVFIGVGSFEKQVVRNIDSFTTYLSERKCPGLEVRSDITPDAGHGAALAQVMQNAIAFGYCERHKITKADPSLYPKFAGRYVLYENDKPVESVNISTGNNKLFLRWDHPQAIPEELLPTEHNKFFIPSNERLEFSFGNEKGSTTLTVFTPDNKEYLLIKDSK